MYTRLFPGHTAFFLAHGHTANENENVPRFVSVMLGLRHSEGGEKTGRFALHHERKSQAFTISLSSFIFFSSKQSSSTGNDGRRRALVWRWCTPPRSDEPPRAPHGRMRRRRRPWPPPPLLLYVRRRRRRLRTEVAAARGSRGSLGAEQQGDGLRKRASSHGDEETFRACDRICACCKRVFYVFQMFHKDVASVSCGCCKSRSGCFNVAT
jgi:hypothetical protein